jgi:nicotinamidase-related amidase
VTARNWEAFALLLIDVQRDFWRHGMEREFPQFEENVARLLALCRAERLDVVHVRARFKPDASDWMVRYRLLGSLPCVEGTGGEEILPCARELPGEPVFYKHSYDAFISPAIPAWLKQRRKRYLLVAGMDTAVCVLLTGASAAQRGFLVAIVADCCADPAGAHDQVLMRYPNVLERVTVDEIVQRHDAWQEQLRALQLLESPSGERTVPRA